MKFLENLYEIENFGIYLFVVIGILIVMFLVVLFFGKKDAEKQSEAKEAFKDIEKEMPLDVSSPKEEPVIPAPVEASALKEEIPPVAVNQVLNGEEQESPKEEVVQEKEFDFDALAAAISKELDSIDTKKEEVVKPVIEEKEEVLVPLYEPEKKRETKPVMPEVFSSVYVNREKETPVEEKSQSVSKPPVDLPKKMELPKRAE